MREMLSFLINFNNFPKIFDHILLEKIRLYQKDGETRRAIEDLLSEEHKSQIAQFESKIYEEEKARRRALMSDEEKRKGMVA
jgi:hypothetical protein